jgi:hypothetical protein
VITTAWMHIVDRARQRPEKRVVVAVGGRPVEDQDANSALLLQPHRHFTPSQVDLR